MPRRDREGSDPLTSLKTVLIIAGSDPTGGAGIGADIRTADRLHAYPLPAVSCPTAQNHHGLSAIFDPGPGALRAQLDALIVDFRPDAVKIGLLPSVDAIATVADFIRCHGLKNVVLDPVLSASCGGGIRDVGDMRRAMAEQLFPLATLVTPNIPEFEAFGNAFPGCWQLPEYVLLKGGHADGNEAVDRLIAADPDREDIIFAMPRIESGNLHGTGCVLSTAIAASLANGADIPDAVASAKDFLWNAIVLSARINFQFPYGPALI